MNKNIYEVSKDRVSNLLSLINRYHKNALIELQVNLNNVTLTVESDSTLDFFNILPDIDIDPNDIQLDDKQIILKKEIENILFNKLKDKNIVIDTDFNEISFIELIELSYTLKFTVKIFPNIQDEIIYLGIGSERLGIHVIQLSCNNIKDFQIPLFNLRTGFISNSNIDFLNKYFNLWVHKDRDESILNLDLAEMEKVLVT